MCSKLLSLTHLRPELWVFLISETLEARVIKYSPRGLDFYAGRAIQIATKTIDRFSSGPCNVNRLYYSNADRVVLLKITIEFCFLDVTV